LLTAYRWPGNVRQLENAIFRAVVLAENDEIGPDEFPQIAATLCRTGDSPEITPEHTEEGIELDAPPVLAPPAFAELPSSEAGRMQPAPLIPSAPFPEAHMVSLLDTRAQFVPSRRWKSMLSGSRLHIIVGKCPKWRGRLGIGRSTLYRKLDTFGLNPEPSTSDNVVAG